MKEYNIIIRLGDDEIKRTIQANNWEEVCDYVFGGIEIINTEED